MQGLTNSSHISLSQTFLKTRVLAPGTRAKGSRTAHEGAFPQTSGAELKGPRPERAGKSLIRARLPLSISSLLDGSLEVPSGTFRHKGWWPHGGPLCGSDSPPSWSPPASVSPSNGKGRSLQSMGRGPEERAEIMAQKSGVEWGSCHKRNWQSQGTEP